MRRSCQCTAACRRRRCLQAPCGLPQYPPQGALGIRSTRDQHEPEEIPDLPNNIVSLGAGHYSSFACTAEASVGP